MVLFSEKQQFRQWWLWFILLFPLAISVFRNYQEKHTFQLDFKSIHLFEFIPILIIFSFTWIMFLKTEITTDGVSVRFFPFHRKPKFFSWHDIESIYVRKYKPLFEEYGTWGGRTFFSEKGIAYCVSGNMVIHLKFNDNNNKSILIGTQNPELVNNALQQVGKYQVEKIK